MTNTDRIAATTTIKTFIEEVNTSYHLNLPTEFPESASRKKIWQTQVEDATQRYGNSVLFTARGDPLDFSPFTIGKSKLITIVIFTDPKTSI